MFIKIYFSYKKNITSGNLKLKQVSNFNDTNIIIIIFYFESCSVSYSLIYIYMIKLIRILFQFNEPMCSQVRMNSSVHAIENTNFFQRMK